MRNFYCVTEFVLITEDSFFELEWEIMRKVTMVFRDMLLLKIVAIIFLFYYKNTIK